MEGRLSIVARERLEQLRNSRNLNQIKERISVLENAMRYTTLIINKRGGRFSASPVLFKYLNSYRGELIDLKNIEKEIENETDRQNA